MAKKQAKIRLRKADVGRLCLIRWDDIGRIESMIVELSDDRKSLRVFDFSSSRLTTAESDQVAELGDYVTPNGLLASTVKEK